MIRSNRLIKHSKPTPLRLALLAALLVMISLFGRAEMAAAQSDADAAAKTIFLPAVAGGTQNADSTTQVEAATHLPLVTVLDTGGMDQIDTGSGAQQDLAGAIIGHGKFGFAWDEPSLSGNNSSDTCTYFKEFDGSVTAVCYSVQFEPGGSITPTFPQYAVYSCRADQYSNGKCTGNPPISTEYSVTCSDPALVAPYFTGDTDQDLQATCVLTGSGGASVDNLLLLNTCTKPSASPASLSNDCLFGEIPAFLKLVKVVQDGTAVPADWTLSWDGPGTSDGSVLGNNTQFVPVESGALTLSESGPAGYEQVSLVCSPTANTDSSVTLASGVQETCTFTNKVSGTAPNLAVTKSNDANHDGTFSDTETVPADVTYPYVVTYQLIIVNNSATAGTISSISDDKTTVSTATSTQSPTCASLVGGPIGANATLTCYYDVTFGDANTAQVVNTATVVATNAFGTSTRSDTSTVNFTTQNPVLSVVKSSTTEEVTVAGQVVPYSYLLTNDGNVTLSGITLSDNNVDVAPSCPVDTLAPGASTTCTAQHTVTQAEMDAGGNLTNVATADSAQTQPVQDTLNIPINQNPHLALTKGTETASFDHVGQIINYTLVATNDGNVTLNNVSIGDLKLGTLACTPTQPATLAPGATLTCTGSHMVTQADIDAGHFANTACVDDGNDGADEACASKDVPENALPDISVTKTANPTSVPETGGDVTFTYVVTNNSDEAAEITELKDDKFVAVAGDADCKVGTILAGGASCSFSATFSIPAGDYPGSHVNIFTVTAKDDDGNEDTATDDESVIYTDRAPAVTVVKTVDANADGTFNDSESLLNADGTATYKYQVTNTSPAAGFDPLTIDTLKDDRGTVATGDDKLLVSGGVVQSSVTLVMTGGDQDNLLESGETWTYTWTAVVQVNAGTPTNTNTATVTARDDEDTSATDDDTASVRFIDYGQITPTGTTCQQYVTGTAVDFGVFYASQGGVVQYQVKANKISALNPGVFFYWTGLSKTITGAGPVFIDQTSNPSGYEFAPVHNDVKLWLVTGTTCTQVQLAAGQITISGGHVTVNVATAAPAGSYYVISVKYDTGSLVGKSKPGGNGIVKYTFTTDVGNNGSIEETDTKGITLEPKK